LGQTLGISKRGSPAYSMGFIAAAFGSGACKDNLHVLLNLFNVPAVSLAG
jgi:hypothetical protein